MSDRVAPGIPNPNETFHRGRDRSYCQSDRRHMLQPDRGGAARRSSSDRAWNAVASDWRFAVDLPRHRPARR